MVGADDAGIAKALGLEVSESWKNSARPGA
jgi:hypothetical protein